MIEQENKPAKYLCHVKKRDKYHISNRGNICLKFVTNGAKAKRGFVAKYSQSKFKIYKIIKKWPKSIKIIKTNRNRLPIDITRFSTVEIRCPR